MGYASRCVIGQETIDRVRRQTGIVSLIGETVKLVHRGRSHVGLCPFHKEKTPSFHVNEERGFYHCFGCSASGDVFKFVMEVEGLSFVEAVRRLAERGGIEIVETASDQDRGRQAEARRRQQELFDVNNAAAAFFERMLREHPLAGHAAAELERRGLGAVSPTDEVADALQAFRVGYAPYGWGALADHLREAGLDHRAAESVGLLVPRKSGAGHYDRFRHRLMFAIIDLQGRVIGFSGRCLDDPSEEELREARIEAVHGNRDEKPAKYVNSPESPIYKKREAVFGLYQARQALRTEGAAVIVEGNFDVVSLHAHGIKNVIAPLGTAFTLEQAQQIKRFSPTLTLLFDGDAAGRNAAASAREPCRTAGLTVRVAVLPEGADPDDVVRNQGAEAIRRTLRAARGLMEHLIDIALDGGFSAADARGRVAKIHEVAELLASEDDPAVRAMAEQHADRIAEKLGIADVRTFRALRATVRQALSGNSQRAAAPAAASAADRFGQAILGALLDYPELLTREEVVVGVELVDGDAAAAIAALRQSLDGGRLEIPETVLAKLPPSIHPFAAARLAAPRHERLEDAIKELSDNVDKLRKLELKRQSGEVVEELQRVAASGDFEQEVELLREQMRRARERHGLEER